MLKKYLVQQVLAPIGRRVLSNASSFMLGLGVAASSVDVILAGLSTVGAVAIELAFSAKARK